MVAALTCSSLSTPAALPICERAWSSSVGLLVQLVCYHVQRESQLESGRRAWTLCMDCFMGQLGGLGLVSWAWWAGDCAEQVWSCGCGEGLTAWGGWACWNHQAYILIASQIISLHSMPLPHRHQQLPKFGGKIKERCLFHLDQCYCHCPTLTCMI